MSNPPEFKEFPKISRLSREVIITEKLDGTNAQVFITESGDIFAGSRTKWITPNEDNYGFAKWVEGNKVDLLKLGPGQHFGEWWGQGIQRNYDMKEKVFSLFNTTRWSDPELRPSCCRIVPVLSSSIFNTLEIQLCLAWLFSEGSVASPGFMKPEGIVIFHTASLTAFKKTIHKDEEWKGKAIK